MAAAQFLLAAHSLMITSDPAGEPQEVGLFAGLNIIFFLGLGLLSAGNGFFKPNISTIVGTLYEQNDARRDGAFTIFYMGINVGALLAGFSGQFAETYGWHWGYLLAGGGMILGQVIFTFGAGLLKGQGMPPRKGALAEPMLAVLPKGLVLFVAVLVFIPLAGYLMSRPDWVQDLSIYIAVPILVYLIWEALRGTKEEAGRMIVIIVLCTFSMMFWAFFELAGSAITLFADQKVYRVLPLVGELKASFVSNVVNPAFILLMGLPFAKLWVWLEKRRMEPSSPLKFALGLAQLGAGFIVMYLGAVQAGPDGTCNIMYLIVGFYLHTTGELCLSPVGLSTITKLSPARLVGMFMGVWFLASALGNVFGGKVGGMSEEHGFGNVFLGIGLVSIGSGVLLFFLTPLLKRLMHGVK